MLLSDEVMSCCAAGTNKRVSQFEMPYIPLGGAGER